MLACQRHLFPLKESDAYLNGASRSPQLKSGADAMRQALQWREENSGMPTEAFFAPVDKLKATFARLVECEHADRIALIPSASYGIATVARNLPLASGQHVIVVADQFPSNYYSWHRLCGDAGAALVTVVNPDGENQWVDAVLDSINADTAAVAIAPLHWADGTLFDLDAIRVRTDEVGAWLIVDGTQAVGAMPFSVSELRPDALVCGGYKWLLGPYGCGYAYYGPRLDTGIPIEENWVNRAGSEDFSRLVDYTFAYRPRAARYCVGQHSNFLSIPMQQAGLDQLLEWRVESIQEYVTSLWAPIVERLTELGFSFPRQRAHHLVGLHMPPGVNRDRLNQELLRRRISVSNRSSVMRVSPNVYNRPDEMQLLLEALSAAV